MKNESIPEVLEVKYANANGSSKSIKLIGNQLLVNNPNPEIINVEEIKEEKWIEFWENLEKIAIWDLEEVYEACNLDGGFNWKIEIEYKNKSINSYGVNVEPKIYIGNRIHSVLEELYKSLEKLIEID